MNKLALSALMIAGLAQATGCIITTDDDEFGFFDVSWTTAGSCVTDGLATVISQNVATQERFADAFACADGAATTNGLPLGDYNVWVELSDSTGAEIVAQSTSQAGVLTFDGDRPALAFVLDTASFGFTWSFSGGGANCADAGADGVDIIATMANTTQAWVTIHNCTAGSATSDPLFLGTYTLIVDLLSGDDPLGSSAPREGTLATANELVDIGNFEFAL